MKHLEGKEVYLRPTGNNARGNKNGYKKATIIKVAKVNITFRIDGRNEQKSRFNGTRISENNSGYQVYETEQEANNDIS